MVLRINIAMQIDKAIMFDYEIEWKVWYRALNQIDSIYDLIIAHENFGDWIEFGTGYQKIESCYYVAAVAD